MRADHLSTAVRHTGDQLLKILFVQFIPVALHLLEKFFFAVALAFPHSPIELAPQVFDRIEVRRLSRPGYTGVKVVRITKVLN